MNEYFIVIACLYNEIQFTTVNNTYKKEKYINSTSQEKLCVYMYCTYVNIVQ